MQTMNSPNTNPNTTTQHAPKRTWLWGLAAAAVVVVGIFALAGRDEGVPTGTDTPAATPAAPSAAPVTPAPPAGPATP